MYFDSWSTSYFFWVIICFAVWGMAGFSVYGAINVFTSRRKKYKKEDPLTLEKIQELKRKAEQDAVIFSQKEERQRRFEKEKEATVKRLEAFVNSASKFEEEKQEVKVIEKAIPKKEEETKGVPDPRAEDESCEGQKEIDQEKLKEIYEKEIKKNQQLDLDNRSIVQEGQDKEETGPLSEEKPAETVSTIEEKIAESEKQHWKNIDDVVRTAFRS